MRRLLCLFLLLLLPLHGFAMQASWPAAGSALGAVHLQDHADGKLHHHHADGSSHYDDSDESAQHVSGHCACQHTALLPSAALPQNPAAPLTLLLSDWQQFLPDPIPERPQRPPALPG
ncbi:MAG: hypothetical protein HYZ65_00530 [Burkholderiales bacterium]|nr:hypothetical protein [Burkholderiales bacterium]